MALVSIGKAAELMGIKVRRLQYLAKSSQIKYQLSATGRKLFDTDNLETASDEDKFEEATEADRFVYTIKRSAEHLNCSVQTIYRLLKKGTLVDYGIPGFKNIYIEVTLLDAYKKAKVEKASKKCTKKIKPTSIAVNEIDTPQKVEAVALIDQYFKAVNLTGHLNYLMQQADCCAEIEGELTGQDLVSWHRDYLFNKINNLANFKVA